MNIHAIIHEQIDWDGTIKSFQLKERNEIGDLWIAFPGDYDTQRNGPFHFLDHEYETYFNDKVANCRHIRISKDNFYHQGEDFIFKTEWHRITTERAHLTYYALYLPQFAVPSEIRVADPYKAGKEFTRTVFRDDEKNRFVLYIECSSNYGVFSFNLFICFHKDVAAFKEATYEDNKTVDFYKHLDPIEWVRSQEERDTVNNFFIHTTYSNHDMGDTYNVNQAGAVGPSSSANHNTFNQQMNSLPVNTNYDQLAEEFEILKKHLGPKANTAEQYAAVGAIAGAEEAAKTKDGNKIINGLSTAGKWVFDAATEIGVDLAAEVIKRSIGM